MIEVKIFPVFIILAGMNGYCWIFVVVLAIASLTRKIKTKKEVKQ